MIFLTVLKPFFLGLDSLCCQPPSFLHHCPSFISPRILAFRAAFTFSPALYPHRGQVKIPSAFFPILLQQLHTLLISFPRTSTSSTDCSRHFWLRRFRIYPLCHMAANCRLLLLLPQGPAAGNPGIYTVFGFSVCRNRFSSWLI